MKDIKIRLLICYHKKAPLFKDDILTPIHVGRAAAREKMGPESEEFRWLEENMIGDDTGDNISLKNPSYNEMTAIYWAWKNYDSLGNPDYIGLMHYRRHFILDDRHLDVYNVRDFDEDTYFDFLNYSEENLKRMVEGSDFLPHIGVVNNVYRHYTENQRKEDLDLANQIILEKYPEYRKTMERYYAGNESNFCNMCIFSRDLFFRYCEWIFSILEEFERRVDMSEKRFFLSERLTGIFVARLMEDKNLKYKKLPIAFIDEPARIPVVLSLNWEEKTQTALSIQSIARNSEGYHSFCFYIFCRPGTSEETKENFRHLVSRYEKCSVEFVETSIREDLLPLAAPDLLPSVNKCICIFGNAVALRDIGEFYRICSADDYFAVGVPEADYDPAEKNKRISADLLVLNCRRMRAHCTAEKAEEMSAEGFTGPDFLNEVCRGEIGYIPWYLFTSEKMEFDSDQLFYSNRSREQFRADAQWKAFMVYDRTDPLEYHQGIYAGWWWENLAMLPLCFQSVKPNLVILERLYAGEQKEINSVREGKYISARGPRYADSCSAPADPHAGEEKWRSYGFWGKLKFYYAHNGLKKTIAYGFHKMIGGNS